MKLNNHIFLASILVITTLSITLPLRPYRPKCMVIYTVQQEENLKLDMKFPELDDSSQHQYFQIDLINTQDYTSVSKKIKGGVYKKQMELKISIVYRLCFTLYSLRQMGIVQVQYMADLQYGEEIKQVKIPQNLLKVEDLSLTYKYAEMLQEKMKIFRDIQISRTQNEDQVFLDNQQKTSSLIIISVIELFIIIFASVYQFWYIRGYLIQKQYI